MHERQVNLFRIGGAWNVADLSDPTKPVLMALHILSIGSEIQIAL
jgi:hypothetical protein